MDVRHAQQANKNTNLTARDEVLGFVTIDVSNEDKTERMQYALNARMHGNVSEWQVR